MKLSYHKMSLLLVVTTMGVLLLRLSTNVDKTENGERKRHSSSNKTATNAKPRVYTWPKCERNTFAANVSGFSSLPDNIKDFLYSRHCRHFPMLLDVPDKCGGLENSSDVFLLLVIKSSPGNYERREVLRRTWARERRHNGRLIRRIFISGTDSKEKTRLNKLLRVEQNLYGDILQWDFTDSFFNLTLKQILFFEWMEANCKNARFMLNGDDDVFANTDKMVEYLQDLKDNDGGKHLYQGTVIKDAGPFRTPLNKYYVPQQVYAPDSYPPYCTGGGFLLSGYSASVIYEQSKDVQLLPIDDVYIAMCLAKAHLGPEPHSGVRIMGMFIPNKMDIHDPCVSRELLLLHRFLPLQIFLLWEQMHDPELQCGLSFHVF